MARMFWKSLEAFTKDARSATQDELEEMREWAARRESDADNSALGRPSAKARRNFRRMKAAADEELERRTR